MTKSMLGRKGFIWLTPSYHSPALKELKQGRNLEAGADAEVIEGVLLTGLFIMACSACFLIEPRIISSEMAPAHWDWP